MKLNQLRDKPGARKKRTRVGRGSSSGLGKTAGRGHKGAKARAGVSIRGFEGGQTALHRRVPKRGFYNLFAKDFAAVNLGRVQAAVDAGKLKAGEVINDAALRAAGLARNARNGVRLLANGALKSKLRLEVAGASKAAIEAVRKAGGEVSTTFKAKLRTNRKGEAGKKAQRRAAAREKRAQSPGA